MKRLIPILAAVLIAALVVPAVSASAESAENPVTSWNRTITSVVLGDSRTATPSASALYVAIAQAAVYDAVMAITRTHAPYASSPEAAPGASVEAAVAAAAHDTLDAYYPDHPTTESAYAASLASIPDGPSKSDGIAVGQRTAAAVVALRQNDGRFASVPAPESTEPGKWRRTNPNASAVTPWTGQVRPFLVRSPDQFRTEGPNALTNADYAEQLDETMRLGAATGSSRTDEQTEIARFWTENTVDQYNRTLRVFAGDRRLATSDTARLLAMTSLTGADAIITCWNTKYHYNGWRPVTAINEADSDGNPATVAPSTTWVPFSTTANHPEYVSGHACLTGAITRSLETFLGTNTIGMTMTSTARDTVPHTFATTDDLRREVENARIYGGDHFRKGGSDGTQLGDHVAKWALHRFFGSR
jgi:hypothetical protein